MPLVQSINNIGGVPPRAASGHVDRGAWASPDLREEGRKGWCQSNDLTQDLCTSNLAKSIVRIEGRERVAKAQRGQELGLEDQRFRAGSRANPKLSRHE